VGQQFGLGLVDLAFQHELLGPSGPSNSVKAAMEVERAQMHLLGDFNQGRPPAKIPAA